MNTLISAFEWTAATSLKTIPIILLVYLLQRFAKKRISASAVHILWLLVLLSLGLPWGWKLEPPPLERMSFSPPSISTPTPIPDEKIVAVEPAYSDRHRTALPLTVPNTSAWDARLTSLFPFIQGIWLAGMLVLALLIFSQAYRYHRIVREAHAGNAELQARLNRLRIQMGIKQPVKLLLSRTLRSPISSGLYRPSIILPAELSTHLNNTETEHILLHEITHIKRKDIVFCWIASLITLIHWFNPFAWLALYNMRRNMEIACDADVLKQLAPAQQKFYGETLITLSDKNSFGCHSTFAVGILENHKQLKERIQMLSQKQTINPSSRTIFALMLLLIAITALAKPDIDSDKAGKTTANDRSAISLQSFAKRAEGDLKVPVLVGQQYADHKIRMPLQLKKLDYGNFLSVLLANNFTAYRSNGLIKIIPLKRARSAAIPVAEANKQYHQDEYVTTFLKLEKACAWTLLPVLRPMVPQHSHLAAAEGRSMLITDSYGNIMRLQRVITEYENGLGKKEECGIKNPFYSKKAKPQKK